MSAPTSEISIPADLLPGDGRFGCGPSKVRPEAVEALAASARDYLGTSHRQASVRFMVAALRNGVSEVLELPDGYEVVLGNGGTTAFWDAATFGLIEQRSQHLSFGEFSSKFAACAQAAPHLDDPDVIESPAGTVPDAKATPDVDAYCFAPQKGLASDGGLWLAALSPAAVERIERIAAGDRWVPASLDLGIALDNSRKDQTYNTPALATIFLAAHQIEWILHNGGLPFAAGRCHRSAGILYGWAERSDYATPFVSDPAIRSHVVGTVDLDDAVDAPTVCAVLRRNGIVDTDSYRKLGRNQLRIALYPAIDPEDVEALTTCIDFVA